MIPKWQQDLIDHKKKFNKAWTSNKITKWYRSAIDKVAHDMARDHFYDVLWTDKDDDQDDDSIGICFEKDRSGLSKLVLKHLVRRGCTGKIHTDEDGEVWITYTHPLLKG